MPKFLIELSMDGYDTPEEEKAACREYIKDMLDSSATDVYIVAEFGEGEEVYNEYGETI